MRLFWGRLRDPAWGQEHLSVRRREYRSGPPDGVWGGAAAGVENQRGRPSGRATRHATRHKTAHTHTTPLGPTRRPARASLHRPDETIAGLFRQKLTPSTAQSAFVTSPS
ncbi:unnamed protein product [Parajaminaea phylloscopi]